MKLVSIIIVNYNGKEVLLDCLESLEKVKYKNLEIIVVDNGSSDGSVSEVQKFFGTKTSKFLLISNSSNTGFAHANNQGAKMAKGEYLLFLNNDTKVTPEFLTKMVEKMESDSTIGVMQPKIFMMDRKGYLDNAGSFLTKSGFLQHWGFGEKDSQSFADEKAILSAKGACLLTKRQIVQSIGLFDERFGSYFEESDFCWRVWLAGWKVVFYPEAYIFHKVGFTSKRMNQIDINYHSIKNRIRSLLKNLSLKNILTIFTMHMALITGLGCYYLLRLQARKFFMIVKAILWNTINIFDTLEKRSEIQAHRRVSDSEIFAQVMVETNLSEMAVHFKKVERNFK